MLISLSTAMAQQIALETLMGENHKYVPRVPLLTSISIFFSVVYTVKFSHLFLRL